MAGTGPTNVLVIGSGGREHALALKLASSRRVQHVFVAPGNAGSVGPNISPVALKELDFAAISAFCKDKAVGLVAVGPEAPLEAGIADALQREGIRVFGPSASAARLESSKSFAKQFMQRHNIPTAPFRVVSSKDEAIAAAKDIGAPVVLKASGLAAGKGVLLPEDDAEFAAALDALFVKKEFGAASDEVVVEQRLEGEEVSVLAFSDGFSIVPLAPAQDHKRLLDNDVGPNTGGMGAYAPAPVATPAVMQQIHQRVLLPTIHGMRREGVRFVGVLFVGLMVTPPTAPAGQTEPFYVLEYNCRFGDPETQAVLPLLDSDLFCIMSACVDGVLDSTPVDILPNASAVAVVCASSGYPGGYAKGKAIQGVVEAECAEGVTVYYAGAQRAGDQVITSGGRVLAVSAVSQKGLPDAISRAYTAVEHVKFEGVQFRRDIGARALKRLENAGKGVSYEDAGVSIEAGDSLVERIKPLVKRTANAGSAADLGLKGVFDVLAMGYRNPLLVSGTDGVGTKLMLAHATGIHTSVGIDLVAMCANDVLMQGAAPLFFLDYYATGKLQVPLASAVISGIVEGCLQSGCALIGGETAEMPGMYHGEDYDLAGFCVGAVEKDNLLPRQVVPGDVLLGLASSGVHSNGFSLVRHLIKLNGISYADKPSFESTAATLGEALVTPTRIYVKSLLPFLEDRDSGLKALAHITGGGIVGNVPRVLPKGTYAEVDAKAWPLPPLFRWLRSLGNVSADEMLKTFNCGIGMVAVVAADKAASVAARLAESGETVFSLGTVKGATDSKPACCVDVLHKSVLEA